VPGAVGGPARATSSTADHGFRLGASARQDGRVKVQLRNPTRTLEVDGPMSIVKLLQQLELNRESVLVIRGGTLVPGDAILDDADEVEIRPVISGGAA
jgi:sulfur carrier protein